MKSLLHKALLCSLLFFGILLAPVAALAADEEANTSPSVTESESSPAESTPEAPAPAPEEPPASSPAPEKPPASSPTPDELPTSTPTEDSSSWEDSSSDFMTEDLYSERLEQIQVLLMYLCGIAIFWTFVECGKLIYRFFNMFF